jgi:hypothetical protein
MGFNLAQIRARNERAACVLDALVPKIETYGLNHGYGGLRLTAPPFAAVLRGKSLLLQSGERPLLICEWHAGLRVRFLAAGDWHRRLPPFLPP